VEKSLVLQNTLASIASGKTSVADGAKAMDEQINKLLNGTEVADECRRDDRTATPPRRHPSQTRPPAGAQAPSRLAPYLLIAPTALVLLAVQGWPLLKLPDPVAAEPHPAQPVHRHRAGVVRAAELSRDPVRRVLLAGVGRTVAFTVVNVALTVLLVRAWRY